MAAEKKQETAPPFVEQRRYERAPERPAPYVVITNHEPRLRSICTDTFDRDRREESTLQLKPGANIVPRESWLAAERLATVRGDLDRRAISVGDDLPTDGLDGVPSEAAVKLLDEVLDAKALRAWSRTEKRPEVQRAIDRQLSRIDAAASPAGAVDRQPWEGASRQSASSAP